MTEVDLGVEALFGLTVITFVFTIGVLLVFKRFSDQAAIRRSKSLAQAHLLELRLFADEPLLVLRSQRDLVVDNLRVIRLLLRPLLILTIPLILAVGALDGLYGHAPIPVGQPSVVTVQLSNPTPAVLEADEGFAVETPPVHVMQQGQLSWRIRPTHEGSAKLRIRTPASVVAKRITAGGGIHYLAERRRASPFAFVLYPTELPFSSEFIRWIEVRYPTAAILGLHWMVWFAAISIIAALLLRRPLGTAF